MSVSKHSSHHHSTEFFMNPFCVHISVTTCLQKYPENSVVSAEFCRAAVVGMLSTRSLVRLRNCTTGSICSCKHISDSGKSDNKTK